MLVLACWVLYEYGSRHELLRDCDPSNRQFWMNFALLANYNGASCKLWNVSLLFQCSFLVPPALFLYLADRNTGYWFAYFGCAASLVWRLAIVFPVDDVLDFVKTSDSLYKHVETRMCETFVGVLLAFSFCDERFTFGDAHDAEHDDKVNHALDLCHHGVSSRRTKTTGLRPYTARWLFTTPGGLFHLVVAVAGPLFIWEGDLQNTNHWSYHLTHVEERFVVVFADLVVSIFFALVLRYALHCEIAGKGLVSKVLESACWHPISELSYTAFLLQVPASYMAYMALGGDDAVHTGYRYFGKLFGVGLAINLALAFVFALLVEWPCRKLIKYR